MKTKSHYLFIALALLAGFGLLPTGRVTAQTFTNLHSFTTTHFKSSGVYTNGDGAYPAAGLILSGNTLFGTASGGGTNGNGTVFAVNTDGTGFTVLHTFTATVTNSSLIYTNSDGANPAAGLLQLGVFLYGTAEYGGTNGNGTVFCLRTDGQYFTNLYNFTALTAPYYQGGKNSDGANPVAGLTLTLGGFSTLCGTAEHGGTNGNGTVFAIYTDGTGFTVLHTFTAYINSTNSDGANPAAGLISSGNTLYGTAGGGGSGSDGTVFALNADGTGFTNLYSFTAYPSLGDGANPDGGLVLSGNTLYGTTHSGGTDYGGTVFAVPTYGTGFTNLHNFTGNSDGDNPYAGLMVSGSTLFGTAGNGGQGDGTLFAVTTNGTGFTTVHTFTALVSVTNSDGASPHASLIISGNTLYGTTEGGGTNGDGTVFSLTLPTPQLTITLSGTNDVVTWPTNVLVFTLQSTTNLAPPMVWTIISPPYAVVNGQNTVTNRISGTQTFYRLSL